MISGLDHLHGLVAYAVVAGLVIAESGFIVGFFVPGEIAVIVGGVLAHEHRVNLAAMLVVANVAAVLAFLIGYAVGWWVGPWLLSRRPLRGNEGVTRSRRLVTRWGGPAVLLGRFVAVVRAVLPGIVGMSDVPLRAFVLYDLVGGLLWATGYTLLGYAVGAGYQHASKALGEWALVGVVVLLAALVVWHFGWRRRRHRAEAGRSRGGGGARSAS